MSWTHQHSVCWKKKNHVTAQSTNKIWHCHSHHIGQNSAAWPLPNSAEVGKYCLPLCLKKKKKERKLVSKQLSSVTCLVGRALPGFFSLSSEAWKSIKTNVQIYLAWHMPSKWKPASALHWLFWVVLPPYKSIYEDIFNNLHTIFSYFNWTITPVTYCIMLETGGQLFTFISVNFTSSPFKVFNSNLP